MQRYCACGVGYGMRALLILIGAIGLLPSSSAAARLPPLANPALLNIGYVCRWENRCMDRHERAMNHALKYVRKYQPPAWKLHQCNRNASRRPHRVDWIGFNNCIRNATLRPQRVRTVRRHRA